MTKNKVLLIILIVLTFTLSACATSADVASRNLSLEAEQFRVERRIVFYNGVTGEWILELIGRCSIEDDGRQLEVTCKIGQDKFKKHFLGLSDNVTYFAEQLESEDVSTYRYSVIFKPATIIPDVELDLGGND